MALGLSKLFIDSVSLTGAVTLDKWTEGQLRDFISQYQRNWPSRSFDRDGLYVGNGSEQHVSFELGRLRKRSPTTTFILVGHVMSAEDRTRKATRQRMERDFAVIEKVLDVMREFRVELDAHAHVNWTFPPDTRKPVINLPLLATEDPNSPYSEIVGIRLRKVVDAKEHSVILDLQTDRTLIVSIRFPYTGVVARDLIDTIVNLGNSWASKYVFETSSG